MDSEDSTGVRAEGQTGGNVARQRGLFGGSKGGGSQPLASPGVLHRVGWLERLTVLQASPAAAPQETLPRTAREGGGRVVAGKLLGLSVVGRTDGGGQRATRHFLATAALPATHRFRSTPTPRRPEIVDPARFCGP